MNTNPWQGSESYSPQTSFMADVQRCCCLCLENTSLWPLGVWPTCSLLHFTLAFGGLAYLFFQSPRHLENLAYLSFHKKKSECHSLTPHPNPPFLEARKGGLASASPASPASVPSLVLRAAGTSSCGLDGEVASNGCGEDAPNLGWMGCELCTSIYRAHYLAYVWHTASIPCAQHPNNRICSVLCAPAPT